jgi:cell division protein FtsL
MKKSLITILGILSIILLCTDSSSAQRRKKKAVKEKTIYEIDTLVSPIPLQRQKLHDDIRKAWRGADASDGAVDNYIWYGDDTLFSQILTQAMLRDVQHLDTMIENLPFTDKSVEQQTKIRYLKALHNMVLRYNRDPKPDPYFYRRLVNNEREMIIARHENKLQEFAKNNANIYTLNNIELLEGFPEERGYVYSEVGKQEPLMMIRRLHEYANEPYASDIIAAAAKLAPNLIYTYASSTNGTLSGAIRRTKDPLVQTIVRITSESKSPLKAMSFLSDIHNKKLTVAEVDKITNDEDLFYKNLVRLKLEQQQLGGDSYTQELAYRGLKYVRKMNDLHEATNAVRFKCIDGKTPEELYFMMVYGQDEIYTSSFIGTYTRMIERMKPMKGDELLEKIHYDHFRTFLRMSAGYGMLDPFLATMDIDKKTKLMKDFVSGLEKGKEDDLEDAVDVADAFASINDSALSDFLQMEVKSNYERVSNERNKKGLIVYGLLATLFDGMRTGHIAGENVGLPPVGQVPYQTLLGDTTVVFEQFYFYGDEDGKVSYYNSFLNNFKDGKWKVDNSNKYWSTFTATSGKPLVIFANHPLPEPQDEEAQAALNKCLAEKNIKPTIIVHRGHSYHLPSTLEHLTKQTRIVMLGSCGGYHNLGKILDASPNAQIISTKQTGTMLVNDKIVRSINEPLVAGNDVDWIKMWGNLDTFFATSKAGQKEYKEYVPPHRNLGALFIKAYRRMANAADEAGE